MSYCYKIVNCRRIRVPNKWQSMSIKDKRKYWMEAQRRHRLAYKFIPLDKNIEDRIFKKVLKKLRQRGKHE